VTVALDVRFLLVQLQVPRELERRQERHYVKEEKEEGGKRVEEAGLVSFGNMMIALLERVVEAGSSCCRFQGEGVHLRRRRKGQERQALPRWIGG